MGAEQRGLVVECRLPINHLQWEEFVVATRSEGRPFDISKQLVWAAYQKVKANKGAAGIDGQSLADFAQDERNNLFKIWNRMSSGPYFPPPVKAVEIPKAGARVCGCSVCRRRRHSHRSCSDDLGFVVVAHPFHPLLGSRLAVLFVKRRGAGAMFVCAGLDGGQVTLPESWTDRGAEPATRRLSVEGLADLAAVTRAIRGC
jgi:Family of unknown function (DUF5372)